MIEVVADDGVRVAVHRWLPAGEPRAVVHLLHGWGEHALRYDRMARALAADGFAVYADDHRGHGVTGVQNDSLGDLGPRGMDGVLDAVRAVSERVMQEHPGAPFFVLGHSWGSFLLQEYVRRWGTGLAGALFTGTTKPAKGEPRRERQSERTPYDWLSRDEAEVDAYIADPLCGFEIMATTPDRPSMTRGDAAAIPTSLPVLVFNGSDDPIGGAEGGRRLASHYESLGLSDVTFRSYEGARHELFNETCRDEVVLDVLRWLGDRTPPPPRG